MASVPGNPVFAADLVAKNPADAMPVTIVSQKVSDDGTQYVGTFETPTGIFRLKIDGAAATFKTASFIVRNQKSWEGISLRTEKESIDLLHSKGVTVKAQGKDCLIEFDADGIDLLKKGGTFQYIDAYR